MATTNTPKVIAVLGATGTGKGVSIKTALKASKPKRLIVFDFMAEYGDFAKHTRSVKDVVNETKKASFKIALIPDKYSFQDQFNFLCDLAYERGDLTFIAEELNKVTSATWAPPTWQEVTSRGRHKNLTVIGASQRPASVDKDFFSNCSVIRSGRLNFDNDIKTMARVLRVGYDDIATLEPLHFIERNTLTNETYNGKLCIPSGGKW